MRQGSEQLMEQIVTEALRRELDGANLSPPEQQMWMRISSRLNRGSRYKRVSLLYRKTAVSVAAILVLAAGVAGFYRLSRMGLKTFNAAGRDAEELAGYPADCSITAVQDQGDAGHSEENFTASAYNDETCHEITASGRSKNSDNFQTDRFGEPPAALGDHYLLEREIVLEGELDGWRGAIYGGPGGKLLWICKIPPAESPEQLLAGVESVFKIPLRLQTPGVNEPGLIVESNTGSPGVVIRDGRCDRLLLVDEGCFTELNLWDILE